MRDLIADCRPVHIQPLKLILSERILAHANELNSSNSRILACIFSKTFGLPKVILEIGTMRLKNINHISDTLISSYDDEVRIGRFDFSIDFIRDTKSP